MTRDEQIDDAVREASEAAHDVTRTAIEMGDAETRHWDAKKRHENALHALAALAREVKP
jgi:hypothetical protein